MFFLFWVGTANMCFSFSILGGPRPHAPSAVRQNVTEAICQVDSQIVAWPAVKGHRRRHTHRLRKSNRCDTKANIIFQLKMRDSVIVNLTNGGKNGITIRLHGFGHRRLDQGAARYSCKFLLDYDGNRYGKGDEGKSRRNYFPDHVSSDVGSWSLDKKIFFDGGQRFSPFDARLQLQCWAGSALQIYQKMGEGWRKMAGRETGEERRSSQKGCRWTIILDRSLLFLSQLSTVKPTVDMTKTGTLSDGSWTGCLILSRTTTGLKKVLGKKPRLLTNTTAKKELTVITGKRFPLTTWASNRPGFLIYIKYKRNKEQAQAL